MKLVISEGTAFYIGNEYADIIPGKENGLYYKDTRYVSKYILKIKNKKPDLLSAKQIDYYSSLHYLTNSGKGLPKDSIGIVRSRYVGKGLHEDIDITSYSDNKLELDLSLEIDCDFADIFEVKSEEIFKKGSIEKNSSEEERKIEYVYKRGNFLRKTSIEFVTSQPIQIRNNIVSFHFSIEPKQSWHLCIIFTLGTEEGTEPTKYT